MLSKMKTHANGQGTELGKEEHRNRSQIDEGLSQSVSPLQGAGRCVLLKSSAHSGRWETESSKVCSQEPRKIRMSLHRAGGAKWLPVICVSLVS